MSLDEDAFVGRVVPLLQRFLAQNQARPADEIVLRGIGGRLYSVVRDRGLPPPLAPGEIGEPGALAEETCAPLIARVLGPVVEPLLAEAVKQLVKACFYPEFKTCRDSFRETTSRGECRRQELSRALRRISGAHCVDCPYWVTLEPDAHGEFLREHWHRPVEGFDAARDVFLPEDFRALRRWLHAAARAR